MRKELRIVLGAAPDWIGEGGQRAYYENFYGEHMVALIQDDRLRVTHSDSGWKTEEVLPTGVQAAREGLDMKPPRLGNLILDMAEAAWVMAVLLTASQVWGRGRRPPIKEAMARVMGDRAMTAVQVVEALRGEGWLPSTENPEQYAAYMLSSSKDVFERVERGVYRVKAMKVVH